MRMVQQNIIEILRKVTLFKSLSDENLSLISTFTEEKLIPEGKEFISQGDLAQSAYMILEGGVRVFRVSEDGDEITLAILGPGEVVGEMGIIDNHPRVASVSTIKNTKVLSLKRSDFLEMLKNHPETAASLLQTLAERVEETDERFEDLFSKSLEERTLKTLEVLAPYFSDQTILLSQEHLAAVIGATRARVTEVLNNLQRKGKVQLSHLKIKLL